jgi:hypothetical protein
MAGFDQERTLWRSGPEPNGTQPPVRDPLLEAPPATILVRSRKTRLYYAGPNRWVSEPDSAVDFQLIQNAARACRCEKLAGVELVLRYEHPVCELRVPLEE